MCREFLGFVSILVGFLGNGHNKPARISKKIAAPFPLTEKTIAVIEMS
jgi:hypothetical protein